MDLGDARARPERLRRHGDRRAGAINRFQRNSDIHKFNERSRFEWLLSRRSIYIIPY
jgi:hypothetical protein